MRQIIYGHLRIRRGNQTIWSPTLSTLSRHPVRIGMLSPRTVLKSNRKLAQQQVPASQHSILIAKLSPPKIRPEMRAHHNRRQHLLTHRTVSPLRKVKTAAGIRDNHLSIILNLIQNPPPPLLRTGWRPCPTGNVHPPWENPVLGHLSSKL